MSRPIWGNKTVIEAKGVDSSLIEPSVRYDNDKHALEVLFDGDKNELPILKSVGYVKLPGTTNFVAYTIQSKGREIIKIEVEEPNVRMIAEESAKIFFANHFMSGDET